tara:strand:+ start:1150 stop:1365 length:216 start_codon:yes stop_codon:yes gene_type:complete
VTHRRCRAEGHEEGHDFAGLRFKFREISNLPENETPVMHRLAKVGLFAAAAILLAAPGSVAFADPDAGGPR